MKVSDIMTQPAIWVMPDTKVEEIARLLVEHNISGVPVVDDAGRVVGIVTETDLVVRNAELHFPRFLQILDSILYLESPKHFEEELRRMLATVAREVMSSPVIVVGPDDPLERAATLMVEKRVNPIPVVKDGKLVGIISRSDIVRLMAREEQGREGGASVHRS